MANFSADEYFLDIGYEQGWTTTIEQNCICIWFLGILKLPETNLTNWRWLIWLPKWKAGMWRWGVEEIKVLKEKKWSEIISVRIRLYDLGSTGVTLMFSYPMKFLVFHWFTFILIFLLGRIAIWKEMVGKAHCCKTTT